MTKQMILTLCLFLAGCTPAIVKTQYYTLNGFKCQSAEITPSWSSKQVPTICKDLLGKWQLVATPGRPGAWSLESIFTAVSAGVAVGVIAEAIGDADFGADITVGLPGNP